MQRFERNSVLQAISQTLGCLLFAASIATSIAVSIAACIAVWQGKIPCSTSKSKKGEARGQHNRPEWSCVSSRRSRLMAPETTAPKDEPMSGMMAGLPPIGAQIKMSIYKEKTSHSSAIP
jgi:cell division protein FtsN